MKQCPNCKTTYPDDSLQFCLADGANLIFVSDPAETVRMSFGNQPMQVNVPPDSVPTIYAQPPISQNPPTKKGFGLIIAGVLGVLLLLVIAGVAAAFIFLRPTDNKSSVATVTPTQTVLPTNLPMNLPTNSSTATPNDETERLKEEMANLKKQMEDQKNQKPNFPTVTAPPNQKGTTARANSPNDGFLALRSEPNSETGYRITKIPHGAALTVLGCPKPSNVGKKSGRWCQVIYNGQSGWAFDAFMTF